MPKRTGLKKILEERVGEEDLQFLIPHPFLPPRFRDISNNRNMIVLLDGDLTLHIRWEGALADEHLPLTPRGFSRLVGEVLQRMTSYRRDLVIFKNFALSNAELPFADPRNDPISFVREPKPASEKEVVVEDEVISIIHLGEILTGSLAEIMSTTGGESPLPDLEDY